MFKGKPDKFPKLKGRAAEIRHLGRPLLAMWQTAMDDDDTMHNLVLICLQASVLMENILDDTAGEYKLEPGLAGKFMAAALDYCQSQSALASWNDWPVFDITMKHHYILHIASRAQWIHPRLGWCFMGEDFMCRIRELAQSVVVGTPPRLISAKMANKIVWAIHFQLSGLRR